MQLVKVSPAGQHLHAAHLLGLKALAMHPSEAQMSYVFFISARMAMT